MSKPSPLFARRGDLLGWRSDTIIGAMIRWVERDVFKREPKSVVNHYGVITRSGTILPVDDVSQRAWVTEALFRGVVEHEVCAEYPPEMLHNLQLLRPLNVCRKGVNTIVKAARGYVGRPYGWLKIIGHLLHLERWLHRDDHPICTWVAAKSYEAEGLDFGKPAAWIGPDDIDDFARDNPKKYMIIRDVQLP